MKPPQKSAVTGILEQFRELAALRGPNGEDAPQPGGEVLAVALYDATGSPIAAVGEEGAAAALGAAVGKLLRGLPRSRGSASGVAELFDEANEYSIPGTGRSAVSLMLRRVGEDWALAAIWTSGVPLERVRTYAAETASRLEGVS